MFAHNGAMQDTNQAGSQLPEWMLDPRPTKTTLAWRIGQAARRNRLRRAVAAMWWRLRSRNRITQRYPKTTAVLAWLLSFITAMLIAAVVYYLYSKAVK